MCFLLCATRSRASDNKGELDPSIRAIRVLQMDKIVRGHWRIGIVAIRWGGEALPTGFVRAEVSMGAMSVIFMA